MKKIISLFVFSLIIISCSKNEGTEENQNNCSTPIFLDALNFETNSVTASWEDKNGSDFFEIQYGPRGFSLGQGITINANSSGKQIQGLNSNFAYDFYVRANCGSDNFSDWAGPHSFVTN